MIVIVGGSIQKHDTNGCGNAEQQRSGQLNSIMAVKLNFRQEIAEADANKYAGCESHHPTDIMTFLCRDRLETEDGQDRPQRTKQREP